MTWQSDLHIKINTICPIKSIRMVDRYVKFTWEIIYDDKATEDQKKRAENIINNFDMKIVDIPEKTEIETLKERIAALEAKL